MNVHLHLTLLGSPRVQLGGKLLTSFATYKAQALLFYLAVTGQPQSRDIVATLLWEQMSDTQAKKNLRTILPDLRYQLGDYIQIDRQTLAFDRSRSYWLDVAVLRRSLEADPASVDLAARQAAVDLYQDEFLQGFYVHNAPLFDAWMSEQREQLHRLVVTALPVLVAEYVQRGNANAALDANRKLLKLNPWSEPVHRQQMFLLAQTGERAAALAQYETCQRILADEFDIEPMPETTALYEQIRAGSAEIAQHGEKIATVAVYDAKPNRQSQAPPTGTEQTTQVLGHNLPQRTRLFGRQAEVTTLQKWIVEDGCHLVGIFGIGGQGKTALATTFVRGLAEINSPSSGYFRHIIWQSLLNAPQVSEVLQEWVYILSDQTVTSLPTGLEQQLGQLLNYLRQQRTLLILDNLESILQSGEQSGSYRPGYEGYGHLIRRLAEGVHRSCLLLTSRERPLELTYSEEDNPAIRVLALTGLPAEAGQQLLRGRGLTDTPAGLSALVQHYSGNPLALKLAAETVQEIFDGDIASFLKSETLVFDDIRHVLDQQFARLSPLERELLLWLAVLREPVPFNTLRSLLAQPPAPRLVLEAVRSLQRHSLLEKYAEGFGLQNVVLEYATNVLIENIGRELFDDKVIRWQRDKATASPSHLTPYFHLNRYALILAQAKEYVRASQTRLLLQPVVTHLVNGLGRQGAEQQLQGALRNLQQAAPRTPGYAAANLLHLLLHLGVELAGYDFSQLSVWRAYLRGATLPHVNFAGADLSGVVFTESLGRVPIVVFSPDGRFLAAGTREGTIHLWRTADQHLEQVIQAHSSSICGLAFYQHATPTGETTLWLASAGEDHAVGLWQMTGEDEPRWRGQLLYGHQQRVIGISFKAAPSQWLLSVDMAGDVFVWEVATGQCYQHFSTQSSEYRAVAFSPDGQLLASGSSDGRVRLWPMVNGDVDSDPSHALALTPSLTLAGHTARVTTVAFHPDGQLLASGARDGRICLWSLPQGQRQQVLDPAYGMVIALAFSPDGKILASTHWDRTVRLWTLDTGQLRHTLVGHTHMIQAVAFHPNGRMLASSGSDQTVRLWDMQTGHALATLRGHYYALNAAALSPDNQLLAGVGYDQLVHLWSWRGEHDAIAHRALQGHRGLIHTVAFSPDGRTIASAGRDPAIHFWDVASGQLYRTLHGHTPDIYRVVFHPNGSLLASGGADGTVRLWNLRSLEPALSGVILQTGVEWIYTLTFSPDGQFLVSAGAGQTIRLWDMTKPHYPELSLARKVVQEADEHEILSLAFSPDGAKLACGGTELVHLWDLQGDAAPVILRHHSDWVMSLAFSPDGAILASSSEDHTICLWNVAQGELRTTLHGHSQGVSSVIFSADGTYLLSAGADGAIKFWDVQRGVCVNTVFVEGPYAGMNIAGATGITEAQKSALKILGAVA